MALGVPESCVVRLGNGETELETTGVRKSRTCQASFEDHEVVLTSCMELTLARGVQDEQCQTLEMARHFLLTTAHENAGDCCFSMKIARLVEAAEALLLLEISRWRNQREQFALTHISMVVSMTFTYIAMHFAKTQLHFDVLIINKAAHLPELETELLFVLQGRKVCHHLPCRKPLRTIRHRPQLRLLPENMSRQVVPLKSM